MWKWPMYVGRNASTIKIIANAWIYWADMTNQPRGCSGKAEGSILHLCYSDCFLQLMIYSWIEPPSWSFGVISVWRSGGWVTCFIDFILTEVLLTGCFWGFRVSGTWSHPRGPGGVLLYCQSQAGDPHTEAQPWSARYQHHHEHQHQHHHQQHHRYPPPPPSNLVPSVAPSIKISSKGTIKVGGEF